MGKVEVIHEGAEATEHPDDTADRARIDSLEAQLARHKAESKPGSGSKFSPAYHRKRMQYIEGEIKRAKAHMAAMKPYRKARDHVHAVGSVPGVTSPEIPVVAAGAAGAAAEESYAVIRLVGGNQYQIAGPYPTQAQADIEAKRFSKHDHVNSEYVVRQGQRAVALYKHGRGVPIPDWARENPTTKETPAAKDAAEAAEGSAAADCGCAPEITVVRPETYEQCLARAAAIGPITTTQKVYELIGPDMAREEQETFVVLPLDARYQLRGGVFKLHKGARASVGVSMSEILKAVLLASADRFIVAHNHPSGKATPSQADRALTKDIAKVTRSLQDVTFLDHVVIGRKEFFSIREDKLYRVK